MLWLYKVERIFLAGQLRIECYCLAANLELCLEGRGSTMELHEEEIAVCGLKILRFTAGFPLDS